MQVTSMVEALENTGETMPRGEFARCMERSLGHTAQGLQGNEVFTAMLGSHGSKKLLLAA